MIWHQIPVAVPSLRTLEHGDFSEDIRVHILSAALPVDCQCSYVDPYRMAYRSLDLATFYFPVKIVQDRIWLGLSNTTKNKEIYTHFL